MVYSVCVCVRSFFFFKCKCEWLPQAKQAPPLRTSEAVGMIPALPTHP